ncbi:MAG: asparagine synthase (glutamine-hydrolyzing) [Gammaproteobacteria bacterium]|nr:asparagine synthase (glutamine-hydrolyzing) [Gammaproteobacteria bacterium]
MCGVAGWFCAAKVARRDAEPRLQRMVQALSHRGPDGEGAYVGKHVALGHRRLAIIDLASGTQPMESGDGSVHIVFNGEIYNFRELRRSLEKQGYAFRTRSDTEVILVLYLAQGWRGFAKLRGMYAFALWDQRTETGWLVRDPLGIKPLFFQHTERGTLSFASEAKALFAGGGHKPELAPEALHLVLNFRYLPGDRSLFEGIEQVSPGQVLEWRPGEALRRHRLPSTAADDLPVLDALEDSVLRHLCADVQVGAYLSGGVDSALVAAFMRQGLGQRFPSFTLDVGDDPMEAANAARTAELLNIDNRRGGCRPVNLERLRRLVWHLEVPKVNSLQLSDVAMLAARQVKVVLSGLGGDELFLGYNAHRIVDRADRVRRQTGGALARGLGRGLALLWSQLPGPVWRESQRALLMLENLGDWPMVYGLLRNVWDVPGLRRVVYGPRMLDAALPNAFDEIRASWPETPDPVMAMRDFEWRQKMVNDLLWQEDRVSMAEGLEVRVPFVDLRLAGSLRRYNREELMPRGKLKGLLAEQVATKLPGEILTRPKSGFQVDSPTFFSGVLAEVADQMLSPQRVAEVGLFNPEFVARIRARRPVKGMRWHFFMLYLMLMTQVWVEVFEGDASGASVGVPA